jgi:phosphoribosylformylglycinamidine cyclo-ligase
VRKIIEVKGADLAQDCGGQSLAQALIAPTRIYVKNLLALARDCEINAIAHITGGGLVENVPRVLPDHLCARIDLSSWQMPPVFSWLQQAGNVEQTEMLRTFNCGAGMIMAIDAKQERQCLDQLETLGETAWVIGEVINRGDQPAVVFA